MGRHCLDNGFNPREFDLIWAAVGTKPGVVPFWVGDADAWYGQAIAASVSSPTPDLRTRRLLKARSVLGRPPKLHGTGQTTMWVPCVTLTEILMPYSRVDLMDMDIQGAELDVLRSAMDMVDAHVRRIHIGTHSAAIEEGLRALFNEREWTKINDFPGQSRAATTYGDIDFGDGVQTLVEPCTRSAR